MPSRVAIRVFLPTLIVLAACNPQRPAAVREHVAARADAVSLRAPSGPAPIAPLATGRFQVVISPRDRGDTFLVDTMTGRVWRLVQRQDLRGEPSVWEHMERLDTRADDYVFAHEHPMRPPRSYR